MRKIKIFSKLFLICTEIFLLSFVLNGVIYSQCPTCECWTDGGGNEWCINCENCDELCRCWNCHGVSSCPGGGGCFTGDTKIATPAGEKEIKDIKEGDVVKSFDAQTGEIRDATVSGIHKTTAPGYWVLKTESGKEVKVTGEHPILAVRGNSLPALDLPEGDKSQILTENLKALFSSLMSFVGKIF